MVAVAGSGDLVDRTVDGLTFGWGLYSIFQDSAGVALGASQAAVVLALKDFVGDLLERKAS